MHVTARIQNSLDSHSVSFASEESTHSLTIPPREQGRGSSVNGGELLLLALATCYGNDVYREAEARGIELDSVDVTVDGDFDGPGEPVRAVRYGVSVVTSADEAIVRELLRHTDTVAEIQNSLRSAVPIELASIEIISDAVATVEAEITTGHVG
ncbi:OsmC family protein [Lacisediminihabitans changchengi]|uniref:OsmC family protein n=1 Tax=Lacisediminihabitans changchengi TaxID=2787634 RepID=A0A934SIB5_9MICO|nr:OsmC family protein [Lacisediminihabitans changchengi]MBK4346123.1 OsmC family protein [Lacisediminihabitans changchengi]